MDKGKKTTFISKGLSKYQGQLEEWECNGIKKPGFEIFTDVINSIKKGKVRLKKKGSSMLLRLSKFCKV